MRQNNNIIRPHKARAITDGGNMIGSSFQLKIKYLFILLIMTAFATLLPAEVNYRVSGKAVFDGTGIPNIDIRAFNLSDNSFVEAKTSREGDFFLHLPNGMYRVTIPGGNGYVAQVPFKTITVSGKNIAHLIFLMEEECTISGRLTYTDGSGVAGANIVAKNHRGTYYTKSNSYGNYRVAGIKASENTQVTYHVPGVNIQRKENLILSEGESLKNIDLQIPRILSIKAKVVDKATNRVVQRVLVYVNDIDGSRISNSSSSAGEFNVYNLEAGRYAVTALHPQYQYQTRYIDYNGTQPLTLTLQLDKLSESSIQSGNDYGLRSPVTATGGQ